MFSILETWVLIALTSFIKTVVYPGGWLFEGVIGELSNIGGIVCMGGDWVGRG